MSLISIDPVKKAEIDRQAALADVDKWFEEQIAAGFTTPEGWKLGMRQEDVALLTGNYVLAKEAAEIGAELPPIIDTDGVPHQLPSIQQMTQLMLSYGQARSAVSAEYAAKRAAVSGG